MFYNQIKFIMFVKEVKETVALTKKKSKLLKQLKTSIKERAKEGKRCYSFFNDEEEAEVVNLLPKKFKISKTKNCTYILW